MDWVGWMEISVGIDSKSTAGANKCIKKQHTWTAAPTFRSCSGGHQHICFEDLKLSSSFCFILAGTYAPRNIYCVFEQYILKPARKTLSYASSKLCPQTQ